MICPILFFLVSLSLYFCIFLLSLIVFHWLSSSLPWNLLGLAWPDETLLTGDLTKPYWALLHLLTDRQTNVQHKGCFRSQKLGSTKPVFISNLCSSPGLHLPFTQNLFKWTSQCPLFSHRKQIPLFRHWFPIPSQSQFGLSSSQPLSLSWYLMTELVPQPKIQNINTNTKHLYIYKL